MSSKYVSETKAARSLSCYIILKRHREIAKVVAHFSDGGTCLVNVFNYGEKNKSAEDENLRFQARTAGGYGYDKFTAALSGCIIDGHKLGNHCQYSKPVPESGCWPRDSVAPRGWHFANWRTRDADGNDLPKNRQGWTSCYRESGLDYLRKIGYNVIQAL